jgi:UDP-glucose 4-epimerase
MEAVKTNTLGGYNVINAAIENEVERVVFLSTDKAVYPISAMGMSKAIMEKIVGASARELDRTRSKTKLCSVRYGNVMYSRGSVIPYFVELMKQGKKLRITNPKMTRFLLPLSYSVSLVLHALEKGENGSIYVKKAPASDIETLALAICKIFDYKTDLEVIGTRAGEKMHETLVSKEEWARIKDQGDFYRIPPETSGLDYEKYFAEGEKSIHEEEGYASDNTNRLSLLETVDLLMTLPEIKDELERRKK